MAEQLDYLNMSDEDWLKAAPPVLDASMEEEAPAVEPEAQADAEPDESEVATSGEPSGEPEAATEDEDGDAEAGEVAEKSSETTEATDAQTQAEIDYKAAYEKLTRPFRANGREIAVKDVDDAIQLMQMGANYNKKMAALKPHLKLMKLLETNGLMSEEQISYLIDLQKKDPAAISKLVKESGVDPMDLDEAKAEGYRPTVRQVDDREIELDQVLEDIQDSPAYSRTLSVVGKEWDGASKQVVADSPQLLRVINAHVENGIYDIIKAEVDNERMYGRLQGLSDIEAYRQIGDRIQARGGFNHIGRNENTAPPQKLTPPSAKPSVEQVQKVKERKRAASPTQAAPAQQAETFNPLAMSDEEFSKLVQSKYL